MTKDDIEAIKPIVAMVCTTVIGALALYLGIDGLVLAGVIGIIGSLGGYTLKSKTS